MFFFKQGLINNNTINKCKSVCASHLKEKKIYDDRSDFLNHQMLKILYWSSSNI